MLLCSDLQFNLGRKLQESFDDHRLPPPPDHLPSKSSRTHIDGNSVLPLSVQMEDTPLVHQEGVNDYTAPDPTGRYWNTMDLFSTRHRNFPKFLDSSEDTDGSNIKKPYDYLELNRQLANAAALNANPEEDLNQVTAEVTSNTHREGYLETEPNTVAEGSSSLVRPQRLQRVEQIDLKVLEWTGFLVYNQSRPLGSGGFGDVYMGEWGALPGLTGALTPPPAVVIKQFRVAPNIAKSNKRGVKVSHTPYSCCIPVVNTVPDNTS